MDEFDDCLSSGTGEIFLGENYSSEFELFFTRLLLRCKNREERDTLRESKPEIFFNYENNIDIEF